MLHRFYAHNSSGSQSRIFMALLLAVTVCFGLSYSGVAKAGTSNQNGNLISGHVSATHAATLYHQPSGKQGTIGQILAQHNAQNKLKPHPNVSGLMATFMDFSYAPIGTNAPHAAGVAVDPYGNIFYSDYTDGIIYEATPTVTGYTLTPIITGHTGAFGLAVDPYDDLYIADSQNHTVFVDFPNGSGGWAELVVDAGLTYPESVALYGNNVFVADESAGQVYEEVYNGNQTWTQTTVFSGAFNSPIAVATDANGDLFVGDWFSGSGYSDLYVLYNSYGSLATPTYITDVFDTITGLAVADNGNLFVTDLGYVDGIPVVYQLYANSYWGYEEGTPLIQNYQGNLLGPYGGAVDSLGNFYTADYFNNGLVEDGSNAGAVQVGYINAPQYYIYANFQISGSGTDGGGLVFTNGELGYDFGNMMDSCAGTTFTANTGYCTVEVGFAPWTAGQRTGGVTVTDTAGNEIGDSPAFFGTGIAPLASYLPGTTFATPYAMNAMVVSKMSAERYSNKNLKKPQQMKGTPESIVHSNWIMNYGGNSADGIFIDPYGAIFVADPVDCVILYSTDQGNSWNALPNYNTEVGQSICPSGGLAVDGSGNVFYTSNNYGGGVPPGVWVDYAYLGLNADSYLVANYTPYDNDVFTEVDAVAVDSLDNVYFTAYDSVAAGEHIFTVPSQGYLGDLSYADVSNDMNYYYVNELPTSFGYLPGISVFTNATNYPVIAVVDYDKGEAFALFGQSTGQYQVEQLARGLDTPSAIQWNPYGDLYILDSGDDTGISVLYQMQPGFALGGPSASYQLTPINISDYANGMPYYWTFTTDSLQNFYITDDGVNAFLNGGTGYITQIDTSDAPTLNFQNTMVGVTSPDSPQTELLSNSGNDVLELMAPATGMNPSISTNYLLNSSYVSYYPGTNTPVGDCPLLSAGASSASINPMTACALPVSFMPMTAGTDTGTLVVTNDTLYGLSPNIFAKGAGRPAKNRLVGLKPSIVPLGEMGRPTSKFHPQVPPTGVAQTINLNGYAAEATPVVTLLSGDNPAMLGNIVPLAVAVDGPGVTPTGVVYVFDVTNPAAPMVLGSATLSSGTATINAMITSSGTFNLQAYYCGTGVFASNACPSTGDGNYMTAWSNTVAQSVVDFAMNFSIIGGGSGSGGGNLPIVKNGQSLSVSFTVSPVGGATFPYAITLSGSGGPQNTSYTFTPSTIPANSGSTAVQLVINIPIDFVASNDVPKTPGNSKLPIAPLALAVLLLPLAGRLRKAGKRFAKMAAVVLLVLAGMTATVTLSGCGANTAAVYQIDVTGTSGSLVHTSTFDIVVE